MVRKTKRLGYRKNKSSSRRKFRGGWDWPWSKKEEDSTPKLFTNNTTKLSPKDEYDKKVKGCISLQKYQPASLPSECTYYLANQTYIEPVGLNADAVFRSPTQEEMHKDHMTLMKASKDGLFIGGRRRSRRSRRYRRKN